MTGETHKNIILDIVNTYPGIKGVELVTQYINALNEKSLLKEDEHDSASDTVSVIESLVKEEKLIEVEYVLSTAPYRVKSIYFPANTKIYCWKNESKPLY